MNLALHEIHIWSKDLTVAPEEEAQQLAVLSEKECQRAKRFRFEVHRRRYIAAHGLLRQILACYLEQPPQAIAFAHTEHQKPYLVAPTRPIQFNMSHSQDMVIYAVTLNHAIGVDIEKMKPHFNPAVAKRFFSSTEYQALMQLPEKDRRAVFYRLWAYKEAMVKALGKGLSFSPSSFSVTLDDSLNKLNLENQTWSLCPLSIHPAYQAAVASQQTIQAIHYWELINQVPTLKHTVHPSQQRNKYR